MGAPEAEPTQDSLWGHSGDPSLGDGYTTKKRFTNPAILSRMGLSLPDSGLCMMEKSCWDTGGQAVPASWGRAVRRLKEEGC